MKKLVLSAVLLLSSLAASGFAQEGEFKGKNAPLDSWLTISGDYRFRYDYLNGESPSFFSALDPALQAWMMGGMIGAPPAPASAQKYRNENLYTNRFGLNLKAKATQDVTVTARLLMYKANGSSNDDATTGGFFADRAGVFDGTVGHVPTDNGLVVDQIFATWSNIAEQPIWFSIGRRPSTGGVPAHLRQNNPRPGNGGVPALLVDYAFDGVTLGYAPDIEALPGAFAKICYGRGFEAGFEASSQKNSLRDTDMVGVQVVPIDTDPLRVTLQYNRGINIFDAAVIDDIDAFSVPLDVNNTGTPVTAMGQPVFMPMNSAPTTNVGDIDWYGIGAIGSLKNVGPGTLNWFVDAAMSETHPNGKAGMMGGLLDGRTRNGWAAYTGLRYDLAGGTKFGAEYNHGSKYWITFAPAADDMWTAKVGTRGNVYEGYIIQELPLKPVSSYLSKAFFKLGYQYYDFEYTGSNNWIGSPVKIADLAKSPANAQFFTPIETAQDVYATFEVHF